MNLDLLAHVIGAIALIGNGTILVRRAIAYRASRVASHDLRDLTDALVASTDRAFDSARHARDAQGRWVS